MSLSQVTYRVPYLSLSHLRSEASLAFAKGIDTLLAKTLPSQWDTQGSGWQEQWDTASRAGVYGSCDGLLLLARATRHGISAEKMRLQQNSTFEHHLAPIFDEDFGAGHPAAERTRLEALTNTMKLAKFVQAGCTLSNVTDNRSMLLKVTGRMYRNGRIRGAFWTATQPAQSPDSDDRIVATGEALRALYSIADHPPRAASESIALLQQHLENTDLKSDWRRSLVACWILSEVPNWITEDELGEVASRFKDILLDTRTDVVLEIKFFNESIGGYGDYYSYNPQLLLTQTVLNFLARGVLGKSELAAVLPTIASVVQQLNETGVYRLQHSDRTFFWEFSQAMIVADSFSQLNSHHLPQELELMYIEPQLFNRKDILVQDDLCAILMPFEAEWSSDVFKVYQSVVTRKGLTWWRSDFDWGVGQLMQQIWEGINRARVIIADCTGRNPNVFYELGIAHTLGKDVFICTQDKNDIPFDLRHITYFEYNTRPTGINALRKRISQYLDTLDR
jgi:hypothetical protein